jgi:hypothetical protein
VLDQHAYKRRNAKLTDVNGNRTLEPVRKQLEEDGRKTALQSKRTNGQRKNKEL